MAVVTGKPIRVLNHDQISISPEGISKDNSATLNCSYWRVGGSSKVESFVLTLFVNYGVNSYAKLT